ncbi:MAG: hypothetical protein HZA24_12290 [Nitrospirae bacterium]|nr:hypothetical protein [Nitrospirota bacterium]
MATPAMRPAARDRLARLAQPLLALWLTAATAAAQPGPVTVDVAAADDGPRITLGWPQPAHAVEVQLDQQTLWLRFDQPLGDAPLQTLPERLPAWIAGVRYGYDTLLIESRRPVRYTVTGTAGGVAITLAAMPLEEPAERPADNSGQGRIDHLRALALAQGGDLKEAQALLRQLSQGAPDDGALATDLARVTESLGDWRGALNGYAHAQTLAPESAGPARARLAREHGPHSRLQALVRDVDGADRQTITTASGRMLWGERGVAGVRAEDRHLSIDGVRRASGAVTAVDRHLGSAELWFGHDWPDGAETQLGMLVNPEGTGFRMSHRNGGWPEETELDAIYHRPYFDYVEGVADDGLQDRLAIAHRRPLGGLLHGSIGVSANRYWIAERRVANGGGLSGALHYGRTPGFLLSYTLDAEYLGHVITFAAPGGGRFRPLPVTDREVHAAGVSYGASGQRLHYGAGAGYAYDRMNDNGLFANLHLVYRLNANLELALQAGRSINANRGGGDTVREYGVSLVWRPAAPDAWGDS